MELYPGAQPSSQKNFLSVLAKDSLKKEIQPFP